MRRLATLAARRRRREKRAIGLQHELAQHSGRGRLTHILPVFEGDDAGEADRGTDLSNALQGFQVARKSVEYTARPAGKRPHERERVVERFAPLVNDAVQAAFSRDVKLLNAAS